MANFTPAGIIHIGRVPFDNSYQHTVISSGWDAASQAADMLTKMTTSLSKSDYKYVRMNNSIRVNFNAESLYTYNYVMYQNANYGSKWFYAFITDCVYINENCTELELELDIIQTWWFDLDLKQCFVEREHVTDDSLDAHLNPEPEMPFEAKIQNSGYLGDLSDMSLVIQTTDKPVQVGPAWIASETVKGGIYNNILSGAKMYKFDTSEISAGIEMLEHLNSAGVGQSVTGLFMFPKNYIPTAGSDYGIPTETQPIYRTYTSIVRPSDLHGYTPHNNKLFTYPYCYARMRHANNETAELKFELWGGAEGYTVKVIVPLDSATTVFAIPLDYQGLAENTAAMLTFGYDVHCSWTMDSFANWVGQNAVSMALGAAGGGAVLGVKATKGLSSATRSVTSKSGWQRDTWRLNKKTNRLRKTVKITQTPSTSERITDPSTLSKEGATALAGAGIASGLGEIATQAAQPNFEVGSASGNALAAVGFENIRWENICILPEFAKIIDGFFDMFGYQVDSVKVPNIFNRPNWNYVKTTNACHSGNIPADDLAGINAIFNSGFTIWHSWSAFGNYENSNK